MGRVQAELIDMTGVWGQEGVSHLELLTVGVLCMCMIVCVCVQER